jgi:hypothetical protein
MSENFKNLSAEDDDDQNVPAQDDVLSILKKMQIHLGYLEKKIDTLIAGQGQGGGNAAPAFKPRFSRPFGGGGGRPPFRGGDRDRGPRDRDRGPRDRDRAPRGESRGGSGGGERSFGGGRPFEKREGSGGHGGFGRKKHGFAPRRDRDR